jgi:hypothetical protein
MIGPQRLPSSPGKTGLMLSVILRSTTEDAPWHLRRAPLSRADHPNGFIPALFSGGDSRIETDPHTGLNKYLCPSRPAPDLVCASSCTASPISVGGFEKAEAAYFDIARAPSPRQRALRLTALTEKIKARLLQYFRVGALARVILCPSGTDALLTAAMLIAAEQPGEAMTAILPSASETGTGVPMAAMCRVFDGPGIGTTLTGRAATTVEIPLRSAGGASLCDDEVNDAFAAATKAAPRGVIVYLTHGTKTGLIAPVSPPRGADVIVDACQARIEPDTVAAYLRQGWPVIVTGSKFFGGPAFSGAVLFPRARLPAIERRLVPFDPNPSGPLNAATLGTALRWAAAIAAVDAFEPLAVGMADVLSNRGAAIEQALAANPALVAIDGMRPRGAGWADLPSIFTFGVRDPMDHDRLLSTAELRPLYERLAYAGVLVGQPVGLGSFGGLRIAIGARQLLDVEDGGLRRLFAALGDLTAHPHAASAVDRNRRDPAPSIEEFMT